MQGYAKLRLRETLESTQERYTRICETTVVIARDLYKYSCKFTRICKATVERDLNECLSTIYKDKQNYGSKGPLWVLKLVLQRYAKQRLKEALISTQTVLPGYTSKRLRKTLIRVRSQENFTRISKTLISTQARSTRSTIAIYFNKYSSKSTMICETWNRPQ